MTFAIHGGRKLVISEAVSQRPPAKVDNALLKALARAHRWRRRIEEGEYASITELAKAEGVNQSYACRLLRLTLLAPEIIETILNGRQDATMTLAALSRPFPANWNEQFEMINRRC
jgi:hypothetical protein